MEISQLESFLCVAQEGNLSRAAEKIHLTQPAVTKQMQALERELKTTLLDRNGRGVELTATGVLLRDYAKQALAMLEECRRTIADTEVGVVGQLILGAGTTTSIFELPRWLQALNKELPGIDVIVRTGESREIVAQTLDREVELGLVTTSIHHPELEMTELFEEEVVLVMASGASRKMLSDYPLILFPRSSGFREYLDQTLISAGIEIKVKMETDSVEAIKSFVASGLGASFLPARAVAAELEAGILHQGVLNGLPPLHRQTAIIRRKDRHLGAGAKALLKILSTSTM